MKRKNFIKALTLLPLTGVHAGALKIPFASESCKTQRDAEGPYYKAQAPMRSEIETDGERLMIRGRVLKADDCTTPLANAIIDIWHCDKHGDYDLEGFKCRGQVKTDAQGKYSFSTIFPPSYGRRPRHIHVKVRGDGFQELTTQIYFQGDPYIKNDFARNAEKVRVIDLVTEKGIKNGVFDVYV